MSTCYKSLEDGVETTSFSGQETAVLIMATRTSQLRKTSPSDNQT